MVEQRGSERFRIIAIILCAFFLVSVAGCGLLRGKLVDTLAKSSPEQATTAPVVASGILYYGSDRGYLHALNARTGKRIWKRKVSNDDGVVVTPPEGRIGIDTLWSSPVVVDDIVYVSSPIEMVTALDARTGKQIWGTRLASIDAGNTPLVTQDTVYASGFGLAALDLTTRAPKWVFDVQENLSAPVLADKTLYFGSSKGMAYALSASTGRVIWKRKIENPIFEDGDLNTPAIANGLLLLSTQRGSLYALNLKNGEEVWKFKPGGSGSSPPAAINGIVYYGTVENRHLYALDLATGKLRWKFKTGPDGTSSQPLINGKTVYFGSWDGNLYALDALSGKEKWRISSGDQIDLKVCLENQIVYFRAHYTGDIIAVDTKTKKTLWDTK